MTHINDELQRLQQTIDQAAKLRILVPELQQRKKLLTARVQELDRVLRREQRDVERLEGWSLAGLYYQATGKIDDQLDKERREAHAAYVKYEPEATALRAVEAELKRAEDALAAADGCEEKFRALLAEKLEALKVRGGETAEKIHGMEAHVQKLEQQKKEVLDAVVAGNLAIYAADQVKFCLNTLQDGPSGIVVPRGVLAGGLQHSIAVDRTLDEVKSFTRDFTARISRLQSKLAKLTVTTAIHIQTPEFRYLPNLHYSTLFMDQDYRDSLNCAQAELASATQAVQSVIAKLSNWTEKITKDIERTQAKLDKLLLSAK